MGSEGLGDSGLDVPMQADAGGRVALVLIGWDLQVQGYGYICSFAGKFIIKLFFCKDKIQSRK